MQYLTQVWISNLGKLRNATVRKTEKLQDKATKTISFQTRDGPCDLLYKKKKKKKKKKNGITAVNGHNTNPNFAC